MTSSSSSGDPAPPGAGGTTTAGVRPAGGSLERRGRGIKAGSTAEEKTGGLGKVCTTVAAPTCEAMAAKAARAFALGADLVELRIDRLGTEARPGAIVKEFAPIAERAILTLRSPEEGGGGYGGDTQDRLSTIGLLARALKPAYLDVELRTAEMHPSWMRSLTAPRKKTIISWHDHSGTPGVGRLRNVLERGRRFDGSLVKIVTHASRMEDNFVVLKLYQGEGRRKRGRGRIGGGGTDLIAFCMGEQGAISRVVSFQAGIPIVYASLPGEPVAPGQLSVATMLGLRAIMEEENRPR